MKKARKHKGESGRSRPDSPSSLSCGRIGAGGGGSYAALLPKRAAEGGTVSPSVAVKQLQGENCDPRKADSTATMKMAASAPSTSTASKQLLQKQQPRMPPPASREASRAALRRLAMGLKQVPAAARGKEAEVTPSNTAFEEEKPRPSSSPPSPFASSSSIPPAPTAVAVLTYDVQLPAAAAAAAAAPPPPPLWRGGGGGSIRTRREARQGGRLRPLRPRRRPRRPPEGEAPTPLPPRCPPGRARRSGPRRGRSGPRRGP